MNQTPNPNKYFLDYQLRWLLDKSRFKIFEKSRRIGATYGQSYEDVIDCLDTPRLPVWFSSADESAAKEYIMYCEQWTKVFKIAGEYLGEQVIDKENDIKAFVIEYANGSRINALRSNPKAFRSKGGKVVLDEYAFHEDPEGLWKAARPCITWGYPIRVLSTYNGKSNRYYQLVEDAKKEGSPWSLHTVDIYKAVDEGLLDKIYGRQTTPEERDAWIEEERRSCFDEDTWQQEYCCHPIDEATAFLTYEQIGACEDVLAGLGLYEDGDRFVGMDVGRKKDLSVIVVLEKVGDVLWTREVKIMEKTPFRYQREELFRRLEGCRRGCIDSTGIGAQLGEEAVESFGSRAEAVVFTGNVKEDLAVTLKRRFEDRQVRIPADRAIREDLHSIRKYATSAGNARYDAARSDLGHADRFWALALAVHAATNQAGPVEYERVRGRNVMFKEKGAF